MATCAKCGATLANSAAFCSSCGSPANTGGRNKQSGPMSVLNLPGIASNVAGLLSYILWPVACIFFLIFGPYNKDTFVRFHAFQGLFLGLAAIGVGIALNIVTSILALIPLIGWLLSSIVWIVFGFGLLGLAISLMYKAYNGQWYRVPLIGDLAARRAGKVQ